MGIRGRGILLGRLNDILDPHEQALDLIENRVRTRVLTGFKLSHPRLYQGRYMVLTVPKKRVVPKGVLSLYAKEREPANELPLDIDPIIVFADEAGFRHPERGLRWRQGGLRFGWSRGRLRGCSYVRSTMTLQARLG